MAASNGANHTRARARRQTTQTIEQIEARAAAVAEAERDVLLDLAAWLRAAAVELPVESKLPHDLAKSAKTLDLFARLGGSPVLYAAGLSCALGPIEREIRRGQ